MNRKLIGFAAIAVTLLTIGVIAVSAQVPGSSSGWAWSSNIGWLSASSTQTGAGGGGSYSLRISGPGNNIIGYMWSSNIGWIEFGNLSGFPSNGSSAGNASVNLLTGAVTGWVRACAGTASGDCSTMTSRTDGWDGWIELSGNRHPTVGQQGYMTDGSGNSIRGVAYNTTTKTLSGYAWGGPVVGWLQFNTGVGTGVTICQGPGCGVSNNQITGNCSVNSQTTDSNTGHVTATFIANPAGGQTPYIYSWPDGGTSRTSNTIVYSSTGSGPIVTVKDSSSPQNSANFQCPTITVNPVNPNGSGISLYIGTSGNNAATNHYTTANVKQGNPFGLAWDTSSITDTANYSCTATDSDNTAPNGNGWSSWPGMTITPSNGNTGTSLSVDPNAAVGPYTFTVTCTPDSTGEQAGDQQLSATANLNVISSSIREQ